MQALRKGVNAYQKESVKSQLASADPHTVISMLMDGIIQRLAQAKGALQRNDLEAKSVNLSKAVAILNALIDGVDTSIDSNISDNLLALYDYMIRQIGEASITNDVAYLDEVTELLLPIKVAWSQISDADKQAAYEKRSQLGAV